MTAGVAQIAVTATKSDFLADAAFAASKRAYEAVFNSASDSVVTYDFAFVTIAVAKPFPGVCNFSAGTASTSLLSLNLRMHLWQPRDPRQEFRTPLRVWSFPSLVLPNAWPLPRQSP